MLFLHLHARDHDGAYLETWINASTIESIRPSGNGASVSYAGTHIYTREPASRILAMMGAEIMVRSDLTTPAEV